MLLFNETNVSKIIQKPKTSSENGLHFDFMDAVLCFCVLAILIFLIYVLIKYYKSQNSEEQIFQYDANLVFYRKIWYALYTFLFLGGLVAYKIFNTVQFSDIKDLVTIPFLISLIGIPLFVDIFFLLTPDKFIWAGNTIEKSVSFKTQIEKNDRLVAKLLQRTNHYIEFIESLESYLDTQLDPEDELNNLLKNYLYLYEAKVVVKIYPETDIAYTVFFNMYKLRFGVGDDVKQSFLSDIKSKNQHSIEDQGIYVLQFMKDSYCYLVAVQSTDLLTVDRHYLFAITTMYSAIRNLR
ncbi:type II toxin-antitoxin system SpoIISA family toxin [Gottfriedia sp. NPDC057948]|uniref:type II toxin-antitoxin system SpoIISA family toxin n=1 Tax=Gottfriedia sp. NPDC057948 TaxID=3346287 RepID=UPI0036D75B6E